MAVNLPQGFVLDEQPQGLPEGFVLDSAAPTQPSFRERLQDSFTTKKELGRQLGLAGRYIVEGAAALPALVANPIAAASNYAFGTNFPEQNQAVSQALTFTGLPEPKNATERVVGDISRGVAGLGTGAPVANLAKAPQYIVNSLGDNLGTQTASTILSAGASGLAREGGYNAGTQLAAGLVGGVLPVGGYQSAARGLRSLVEGGKDVTKPFTTSGREQIVGSILKENAIRPNDVINNLDNVVQYIPDSPVTTGEAAGDAGIAALQRGFRNQAGSAFADIESQQNAARQQALSEIAKTPAELKQLQLERSKNASNLYDAAFEGGSTAPLERQFQNQFYELGNIERQAQKTLNDANNQLTLARRAQSAAGENVYATSSANSLAEQAEKSYQEAQAAVQAAKSEKNLVRERLKLAQQDGSANAPGAVWTPRVQQFLDQPEIKSGISRGLKIQRLEAVAAGKPFNPKEYAITGYDAAGEPVVGAVPNMRLLDAGKKGLDAMIADNTDSITGRVNEMGRALTQFKKAYLTELDSLNPKYEQARKDFSELSKPIEQMQTLQDLQNKVSLTGSPDIRAGYEFLSQPKLTAALRDPALEKILTPEQFQQLKNISADAERSASLNTRNIRASGSDTAQNLNGGKVVKQFLSQHAVGKLPLGIGRVLQSMSEKQINELTMQALKDPQLARRLLVELKPETAKQSLSGAATQKLTAQLLGSMRGTISTQTEQVQQ